MGFLARGPPGRHPSVPDARTGQRSPGIGGRSSGVSLLQPAGLVGPWSELWSLTRSGSGRGPYGR